MVSEHGGADFSKKWILLNYSYSRRRTERKGRVNAKNGTRVVMPKILRTRHSIDSAVQPVHS